MKTMRFMHPLNVLTALTVLLFVTGCQTAPSVHTKMKPAVEFGRCKSFVMLPLVGAQPTNEFAPTWQLPPEAREAAAIALAARGFLEMTDERANLCVLLRGNTVPQMEVTEWSFGGRGGGSVVSAPEPHQHYRPRLVGVREPWRTTSRYYERTLIVEIFDNKTKEPLWAGWSTSRSSRPVETEQVTNAVRRILERFPPVANSMP